LVIPLAVSGLCIGKVKSAKTNNGIL